MSDANPNPIPTHGGRRWWGFLKCLFTPRACQRLRQLLYQYVEGELDAQTHQQLKQHLADCPHCLEYVESYRQTISLCRCHGTPAKPMPAELQNKLQEFIEKHPELK